MILFTNSQKPYLLDLNLVREPPLPVIRSISEILMGNLWIILSGFLVLGILLFFVFLSRRKKAEQIVEDKEIEVDPFPIMAESKVFVPAFFPSTLKGLSTVKLIDT